MAVLFGVMICVDDGQSMGYRLLHQISTQKRACRHQLQHRRPTGS